MPSPVLSTAECELSLDGDSLTLTIKGRGDGEFDITLSVEALLAALWDLGIKDARHA